MSTEHETSEQKFNRKINELHWTAKARALGAFERQEAELARQKPIRDDVEKYGDRVIEITEFNNYSIVKFFRRHDKDEWYQVYINGVRVNRITKDPKIALLVALSVEHDGINTKAHDLIARMLGIKEEN